MIRVTVPLTRTRRVPVKPGPTKPAIQISDADRKRKILITDKCTMALKKWREKGESFRVDRYRRIEGRKKQVFSLSLQGSSARSLPTQLTENPERA